MLIDHTLAIYLELLMQWMFCHIVCH